MYADYELIPLALSIGPSLEVSGYPKPGNVHRLRDHPDKTFEDFLISSHVLYLFIRGAFMNGLEGGWNVGKLIFSAVELACRLTGGRNTCLGTATLLIPLAHTAGRLVGSGTAPKVKVLAEETAGELRRRSTVDDAVWFYKAIREANPSYVKATRSPVEGLLPDVWSPNFEGGLREGNIRLWDVLEISSSWDVVSGECINGYENSLFVMDILQQLSKMGWSWNKSVVYVYLRLLSKELDSLILRRQGEEIARLMRRMAEDVLINDWNGEIPPSVWRLDGELQERGWNPGSIADIVASGISLYYYEVMLSGSIRIA